MFRLIITAIFWLQWTLVTSLCLALVLPMWKFVSLWSLLVYWFLLGFSQALLLLQRLPRAFASWFTTTSFIGVGWLVLLAILFCLSFFVALSIVGPAPFFGEQIEALGFVVIQTLPISFLIVAGGGTLLGWAQWRVLRRHITRTNWLIIASVVSWVLGAIMLPLLLFSFRTELLIESKWNLTLIMTILAGVGAIGGAIKGGVLAWLLHRARR